MKEIKSMFSSPKKIAIFAVCSVLILGLLALGGAYAVTSLVNKQGIGAEEATNLALKNAGFSQSEVKGLRSHYEYDDGLKVYEVDFYAGGFEYDYLISADDGTILESHREVSDSLLYSSDNQQGTGNVSSSQEDIGGKATQSTLPQGQTDTDKSESTESGASQQGTTQSGSSQSGNSQSATSQSGGTPSGNTQGESSSQYIGTDKAKALALSHAGVDSSSAVFTKAILDRDDGFYVYELEFHSGNMEYEYELDAITGAVKDFDKDYID